MEFKMLSDKFVKDNENSNNVNLSKQIERLEELSHSMANLIENGNSPKIVHLEKVRQKILKDIIKKREPIDEKLQPKISNIIDLNNIMIKKVNNQKTRSLSRIRKQIKCCKSYQDL